MKKIITPQTPTPLLKFLFLSFPDTKKTRIKQWLKFRGISVNGKTTTRFDYPLQAGDEVKVTNEKIRPATPTLNFNLEIIYEDENIILVNKPAGLLTIGSEKIQRETAIFAVNDYLNKKAHHRKLGELRYRKCVFVVHRIDRDVSGILLFAKDEQVKLALQENWGSVVKEYYAVVEGQPKQSKGTLVSYLTENQFLRVFSGPRTPDSKKAVTHYEVIKTGSLYSLLKIRIDTGRKHQIRVQLSDMGCPIVGDKTYGARPHLIRRIALHAASLEFDHPVTGKRCHFSSPLPIDLERLMSEI